MNVDTSITIRLERQDKFQVRRLSEGYLYSYLSMVYVEYSQYVDTLKDIENILIDQFGSKSDSLICQLYAEI